MKIEDVGDTEFLVDEQVDRFRFLEENERVIAARRPAGAIGRPLLLGITKASLSTESFISAASFQETTRVLTEAAISRQGRLPARPEGERHHRPPDPGRHRAWRSTTTSTSRRICRTTEPAADEMYFESRRGDPDLPR